jgi:hypothetical protein
MPFFVTVGDTALVTATFRDWDGIPSDPTNVVVKVYNVNNTSTTLATQNLGNSHNGDDFGEYQYLFKQDTPGAYFVEFSGTLNGSAIARRVRIDVREVTT